MLVLDQMIKKIREVPICLCTILLVLLVASDLGVIKDKWKLLKSLQKSSKT